MTSPPNPASPEPGEVAYPDIVWTGGGLYGLGHDMFDVPRRAHYKAGRTPLEGGVGGTWHNRPVLCGWSI